jgi:hypothetical protein
MDILEEARNLIYGVRAAAYGHPKVSISNIAKMWSIVLGTAITPRQVCLCMALLKISRDSTGKENRENILDAIGYLALIERLEESEETKSEEPNFISS